MSPDLPAALPAAMIDAAARATEGHHIKLFRDGWLCACGDHGDDPDPRGDGYRHLVALELAAALAECEVREQAGLRHDDYEHWTVMGVPSPGWLPIRRLVITTPAEPVASPVDTPREDTPVTEYDIEAELAKALNLDEWNHPSDLVVTARALRIGDELGASMLVEARSEGVAEGRQIASDAILAHADKHAPKDGNEAQRRLRRHLHIAARVALPTVTVAEAAAALAASLTPTTEEAGQ